MDKEFLYMQKLAGIITESEYKAKLEEIKQDENFSKDLKDLESMSLEYVSKYGKIKIKP
jgi:hypothetical protein